MRIPDKFTKTIIFITKNLQEYHYAFRGAVSLVLQGIDMNIDDIDILCDKKSALACNQVFKDYLVEKVSFKESEKFRSYFGKFKINGIDVEAMGDWQIKNPKGYWSNVFNASDRISIMPNFPKLRGSKIWLTTIDSELKMFAAMGRWNAYWKIKKQLSKNIDK